MWLTGKVRVLAQLHSATRYSAVGCEFNVNELTIYIKSNVFKQRHVKQGYALVG